MKHINLGILKTQTGITMCKECASQHKCSHIDERGSVYCGDCANRLMGVPHDTPADQEALNKAIAKRDSGQVEEVVKPPTDPAGHSDQLIKDIQDFCKPKSNTTNFAIKKIATGLVLTYNNEEHYFMSKTALLKHLDKEVLSA